MAVTKTVSDAYKEYLRDPLETHTYKLILMGTAFAFDAASHEKLSDVTTSQLSTGNGYTQDNITLENVALSTSGNAAITSWSTVTITATGGIIGPFGAAIIYDDTHTDDLILACIDIGTDESIADGESYQFKTPSVNIG